MKCKKRTVGLFMIGILIFTLFFVNANAAPTISSWHNDVTDDDSLDILLNVSKSITFNVSSDQRGVTWTWMVDGEDQDTWQDTYNCSFGKYGIYNVSVYGSDGDLKTQTILWNVTVFLTATDDLGTTINISKKPQRIVSLSPSNTEILFALGLEDSIVGVTDFCDYPPEAGAKNKVGSFTNPNVEKIIEKLLPEP